jgi:hypothetical protein
MAMSLGRSHKLNISMPPLIHTAEALSTCIIT